MKNIIPIKILLSVSGLIALFIGFSLLVDPAGFEASSGIDLGGDINLLNELRAPAGNLVLFGILMLSGVFVNKWRALALFTTTIVYLGYGLSRIVSIIIDGMPHEVLIMALMIELVVGFLSLWALISYNKTEEFKFSPA